MKRNLRGFYLLVSTLVIGLFQLPFAFGRTVFGGKPFITASTTMGPSDSLQATIPIPSVYDSLHLDVLGLSRKAFDYAQKGWGKLIEQGKVTNAAILSIVDFSQPSSHKRLYVLDLKNYKVLFQTLVAHGKNSGRELATSFSNKPSSFKSSPGFYITGETYTGGNGYSLKLNGVEKGINDKASQ